MGFVLSTLCFSAHRIVQLAVQGGSYDTHELRILLYSTYSNQNCTQLRFCQTKGLSKAFFVILCKKASIVMFLYNIDIVKSLFRRI